MVNPIASHFFAFKAFNKFQKTISKFEGQAVQLIEAVLFDLLGLAISNEAGNAFTQ